MLPSGNFRTEKECTDVWCNVSASTICLVCKPISSFLFWQYSDVHGKYEKNWWVCGCCRAKSKSHNRQWAGSPKQHLKQGSELLLSCGWNAALQEMPIRTHQIYVPTRVSQKLSSRLQHWKNYADAACSSVLHRALVLLILKALQTVNICCLEEMMESPLQHVLRGSRGKAGYPQNLSEITLNNMFVFGLYSEVSILDFKQRTMISM